MGDDRQPPRDAARVELVWPGKYDEAGERARLPESDARVRVEARLGGAGEGAAIDGRLLLGDNLDALAALARPGPGSLLEQIDLVYIDPPFATGGRFSVVTRVGEEGEFTAPAYDDSWEGGLAGFLRMLDPRLRLIHRLLAPHGSLYLHVDPTVGHAVKLLADEIFGDGCFQREIVWRIGWLSGFKTRARNWIRNHDLIFFYTKRPAGFTFHKRYVPHPEGYRRRDGALPRGPGVPLEDVWNANASEAALRGRASLDSIQIKSFSTEKTGWATQKNESVLERIIAASSSPGDLVADFFCGSGTTLAVAHQLGRRFLGCDGAEAAVHITAKRLLDLDSPPALELCAVAGDERPIDLSVFLDMFQATPVDDGLDGLAEGGALALRVDLDEPWTLEVIAAARAAARRRGAARLVVIGRRFAFPAEALRGEAAICCLEPTRALLDPRARARGDRFALLRERAIGAVEIAGDGAAPRLRLVGYGRAHPEHVHPEVRKAIQDWRDWIDWWSIEYAPTPDAPQRPDELHFRTPRRRALPLESAPRAEGFAGARVRVVDVIGGVWEHTVPTPSDAR